MEHTIRGRPSWPRIKEHPLSYRCRPARALGGHTYHPYAQGISVKIRGCMV